MLVNWSPSPILTVIMIFQMFVFCVTVLTSAVVGVAYWVGLPYWWQRCPYTATFFVIFGNWLLMNIVFHYYKAVTTAPGFPPEVSFIRQKLQNQRLTVFRTLLFQGIERVWGSREGKQKITHKSLGRMGNYVDNLQTVGRKLLCCFYGTTICINMAVWSQVDTMPNPQIIVSVWVFKTRNEAISPF